MARRQATALPHAFDSVGVEHRVAAHEGEVFRFALGDEQAVERVAVVVRLARHRRDVRVSDRQRFETVQRPLLLK